MNSGRDHWRRIEQIDRRCEAGTRLLDADDGAVGREFVANEKTTRARLSGLGGGFAIADEGDFAWSGGFERRGAGDVKIAGSLSCL